MKIIIPSLLLALLALSSCRGGGGPATRVGRGVDHAFSKVGQGVKKAGQTIENVAN